MRNSEIRDCVSAFGHTAVLARTSILAAFALLLLQTAVWAEPGYVPAASLARAHGLKYKDMSQDGMHICKIEGRGHKAVFFAGLRNISVDNTFHMLARPVKWNGRALMVPKEAARVLAGRLGDPVYRPKSSGKHGRGSFKVVIDAGHGGRDPGAIGRGGLKEKTVNLDISRKLSAYLKKRGVTVVMTRDRDVAVSLDDRVRIVNKAKPDLFISIHANAERTRRRRGAMTLYPDNGISAFRKTAARKSLSIEKLGPGGRVGRAALLAVTSATLGAYRVRSIEASRHIQESLEPVTGTIPRENGVIEDFRGLRVLRNAHVPRVLVEVDFLSNTISERKLRRSSYRKSIAEAIGRAVIKYRKSLENE